MTKHTLPAFSIFLIAIFAGYIGAQESKESRVWKSNSGKFSVEATFEKVDGDNVYLRNKDGKQLKIQLSKLSDADQSYVESQEENPFETTDAEEPKEADANKPWEPVKDADVEIKWGSTWYAGVILEVKGPDAFHIHYNHHSGTSFDETVPRSRVRKPGGGGEGTAAGKFPVEHVKLTDASLISMDSGKWNLPVTTPPETRKIKKVAAALNKTPSRISQTDFFVNQDHSMMFFALEKASGSRAEKLAAVDLKAGKLVGNAELPFSKNYLRDVSADGTILLSSSGTFFPEQNRFDLWKIGKKGELIHFKGATTPKKIANARFVSGQRVALIDESNTVSIWDTQSDPKVLFKTLSLGHSRSRVQVSSDRKHLFVGVRNKIFAINAEEGTCSGIIEPSATSSTFAVHPDLSQIAVASKQRIQIWNNKGEQTADFFVPSKHGYKLAWLDDRYLATTNTIIDTHSKIELCSIAMPPYHTLDPRGVHWAYDTRNRVLTSRKFETEEFPDMSPKELQQNQILKPGSKVAIRISASMPSKDKKEVEESLTKLIESRGMTVDPSSNIKIVCTQKNSKETKEYSVSGFGRSRSRTQSATVTKRVQKMALVVDGKELYYLSSTQGGASSLVMVRGNETIQEAANKQAGTASYEFFKNFDLPKDFYLHPDNEAFEKLNFSNL